MLWLIGWGDTGYHREEASKEVVTPTMDGLVAEGVELTRFYGKESVHNTQNTAHTTPQQTRVSACAYLVLMAVFSETES